MYNSCSIVDFPQKACLNVANYAQSTKCMSVLLKYFFFFIFFKP